MRLQNKVLVLVQYLFSHLKLNNLPNKVFVLNFEGGADECIRN